MRTGDLESRELSLFERLARQPGFDVTAFGDLTETPYGFEGTGIEAHIFPSLQARFQRLPLGTTLDRRLRAAAHVNTAISPGLSRALRPYDIVNLRETFHPQNARSVRFRRPRGQRYVVSCIENIPFRFDEDPELSGYKRLVQSSADWFIANSPGARRALELEGVPGHMISLIPNAVDDQRFKPGAFNEGIRRTWRVNPEHIVIVYAGRLLAAKGLVEALLALEDLLHANANVRVVFHGTGPERHRLECVTQARGLQRSVTFSPWVSFERMPEVYRAADIVLLPSLEAPYWQEQFGFNLVEAMACGRPVLGADTGEIKWVLGAGGMTYDPHDPRQLRESVESLMSPEARAAVGKRARAEVADRFSCDVVCQDLASLFRAVLRRPPAAASSGRP